MLLKIPESRSLITKMMLERVASAGFGTAITTLVAVQPHVTWLPFHENGGISGLAALGIIAVFGGIGALFSNSLGQSLVEKHGVRFSFVMSAIIQTIVVAAFLLAIIFHSVTSLGIIGLGVLSFVLSISTPGLSGLARAWWNEIGLSKTLAARGGALEPTLAAIAWSVGPIIAAPIVLVSPWTIVVLGGGTALGLLLLSKLPNPYKGTQQKINAPSVDVRTKSKGILRDWWMAGTYSFYHIARSLLNSGSTAVLLGAGQSGLIGAATAAPSVGHAIAGVAFAARKNPEANLKKAVMVGLLGQALPTLIIASVFWIWPQPNMVATILLVVGGGAIIGILKAPVAAAIYPLAVENRPEITVGRSASRIANGMIMGGLLGPLFGTVIIITMGTAWLLPFSVIALAICACGVMLDGRITGAK